MHIESTTHYRESIITALLGIYLLIAWGFIAQSVGSANAKETNSDQESKDSIGSDHSSSDTDKASDHKDDNKKHKDPFILPFP